MSKGRNTTAAVTYGNRPQVRLSFSLYSFKPTNQFCCFTH